MLGVLQKYDVMKGVIDRCNDLVLEVLQSSSIREAKIAAESFKNGGKRLRPALMLLSSMATNGSRVDEVDPPLIELAASVELIHLATLFHDDVIDEVETRRMQLSARAKYGNHASVLAGDFVLAEALLLVQKSKMLHTMPEFLRTIRVLVSGESRETLHKFDYGMNETEYYEIISEKSASLFALSCKVGGMSRQPELADLLGNFGWNLGMAFQMIDDMDDMLAIRNGTTDCDLRNGYFSIPLIRALTSLQDGHRDKLIDIIRRAEYSADEKKHIVTMCNDHGGTQQASDKIRQHLDGAEDALESLEDTEAKRLLHAIVDDLRAYADIQLNDFVRFADARTQQK